MNYDLEMEKQMQSIRPGERVLLHACCAPCSSAVLERLADYFEVTIFYYNPNITEIREYHKRLEEIQKLISTVRAKYRVSLLEGPYDPDSFFSIAKGLEDVPERGERCFKCYQLRLRETALMAEKLNYPFFCTTLTLSPHKNAIWINEIGASLENEFSSTYLYSDFKKKNGYKRSIELSKKLNLYRQDYCGCIYSKRDRMKEKTYNIIEEKDVVR